MHAHAPKLYGMGHLALEDNKYVCSRLYLRSSKTQLLSIIIVQTKLAKAAFHILRANALEYFILSETIAMFVAYVKREYRLLEIIYSLSIGLASCK